MNGKSVKILKEKERLVMKSFIFFFITGMILFAFSMYYSITLIANASAAAPPDFSSLNIINITGGVFWAITFFLLLFWAYLRDKRKKMEAPFAIPGQEGAVQRMERKVG